MPRQPIFGFRLAIILVVMICSDTLFDSRGGFFWVKLSEENIPVVEIECLRVVATATNFGTKISITGFVRTIVVTRQYGHGGGLSGQPTEYRYCRADTLHIGDVAMATIFWLSV